MEIDKIKRVALGCASKEEKAEVDAWAQSSEERRRFVEDTMAYYAKDMSGEDAVAERVERMWRGMPFPRKRRRVATYWRWVSVAACAVLMVGMFLWEQLGDGREAESVLPRQVAQSRAIQLILPDGSVHEIAAADAALKDIPGFEANRESMVQKQTSATDTAAMSGIEYNEIIVPRGGEYLLTLADGTNVILNSETRLRFPNSFVGKERKIYLSGEAYFEVSRDENHPFLVEFEGGKVRVLGTQFNVKAYRGQNTFAALVSGKVEVMSGRDSVVLQPGELCEITTDDHSLAVSEADMISVLAWKNGEFVLKNASWEQVMSELARWYDAEIVYDSSELQGMKFHIYMDRAKTLEEALQIISKMGEITYRVEGRKIIIKKR